MNLKIANPKKFYYVNFKMLLIIISSKIKKLLTYK